jgi:hypothetical protein
MTETTRNGSSPTAPSITTPRGRSHTFTCTPRVLIYKQMQPTRPAPLWVALSLLLVGARAGCAIAPDANGHVDYPAGATAIPHRASSAVAAGASVSYDASPAPLMNVSPASLSHVTRRLVQINVQPGSGTLQAALDGASDGDELVLANGTYTASGSNSLLTVNKSVTIRALHARGAVLEEQNARRRVSITSGTVVLEGLDITGWHPRGTVRIALPARHERVSTAIQRPLDDG